MISFLRKFSSRTVQASGVGLLTVGIFVALNQFLSLTPLEITLMALLLLSGFVLIFFWATPQATSILTEVKQGGILLQSVLENMGDGVVVVSSKLEFLHFNQAATRILEVGSGRKAGEWSADFSVCNEDKITPVKKENLAVLRALRGEKVIDDLVFIRNKKVPQGFYMSVSAQPLPDRYGKIQGAVAVFRDVDHIRRREDELRSSNEFLGKKVEQQGGELKKSESQVQQLQKMDAIGRLAGGVAHDFNNILGAMNMYCDLMLDNLPNSELLQKNINEIKAASDQASALTRQLLVFSRKQVSQMQIFDMNVLLNQHLKMLRRLIGENYRIDLKPHSGGTMVKLDPAQVEQIVLNLVMNARDAMPQGGTIRMETSIVELAEEMSQFGLTVTPGKYLVLTISDHGIGMSAATVSQIFEPFFTTKPTGKGTGMGLTTVYGIVKHGLGTIDVNSRDGEGSAFKIFLPATEEQPPVADQLETKNFPKPAIATTILIVEDEDKLRNLFAQALKAQGFKILVAMDGLEAMALLEKAKIHLLLTDVIMPTMSGIELAKYARSHFPDIRVLLMSGYTNENVEALATGEKESFEFLEKPFNTKQLMAKIRIALGN